MKAQQRKQKSEEKVDLKIHSGEKPVVPFEVDILAAEDFDRIYRSRPLSPERELIAAVLEEALIDYQRYLSARDGKGMKRFAEAEAWILEKDAEWIFSFINCCDVLGIDPDYLRQGLVRWKRAKLSRIEVASVARRQKAPKRLFRAAA
jgi:hypothetical protein